MIIWMNASQSIAVRNSNGCSVEPQLRHFRPLSLACKHVRRQTNSVCGEAYILRGFALKHSDVQEVPANDPMIFFTCTVLRRAAFTHFQSSMLLEMPLTGSSTEQASFMTWSRIQYQMQYPLGSSPRRPIQTVAEQMHH